MRDKNLSLQNKKKYPPRELARAPRYSLDINLLWDNLTVKRWLISEYLLEYIY